MSLLLFIQELLILYKTKPQFHFECLLIFYIFSGGQYFDILSLTH